MNNEDIIKKLTEIELKLNQLNLVSELIGVELISLRYGISEEIKSKETEGPKSDCKGISIDEFYQFLNNLGYIVNTNVLSVDESIIITVYDRRKYKIIYKQRFKCRDTFSSYLKMFNSIQHLINNYFNHD